MYVNKKREVNKMENETVKFEAGKTYYYRFIGDSDLVVKCKITKRTAKTITYVELDENKTYTKRIREYFGVECVSIASYSMAPVLFADRLAA